MTNKELLLKKLRAKYDKTRAERGTYIDAIKARRFELAKYTFADLDSHGKNPYFKTIRNKERKLKKRYNLLDGRLNKLDTKINSLLLWRNN